MSMTLRERPRGDEIKVIAMEEEGVFRSYRRWRFLGGGILCVSAFYFGGIAPLMALYGAWDPIGLVVGLKETWVLGGYVIVVLTALPSVLSVLLDGAGRVQAVLYKTGIVPPHGSYMARRTERFIPFADITHVEFVHARGNDFCNVTSRVAKCNFT